MIKQTARTFPSLEGPLCVPRPLSHNPVAYPFFVFVILKRECFSK